MGVGERGEAPGCWSGDVPDTMRPARESGRGEPLGCGTCSP